jgi:hypothetical protein
LGQTADFSALMVLEQRSRMRTTDRPIYFGRHLQRWPLGTTYTAIVADLRMMISKLPVAGSTLVVDATGCGRPVIDMIRQAQLPVGLVPVIITSGHARTRSANGYHVPKRELVSLLQILLQSRRLQIARALPEAATLEKELLNFELRLTPAAHESYAAGAGAHDDLVMALAIAGWAGETLGSARANDANRELVYYPPVRDQASTAKFSSAGDLQSPFLRILDRDGYEIEISGHRIYLPDEPDWWNPS